MDKSIVNAEIIRRMINSQIEDLVTKQKMFIFRCDLINRCKE